MNKYSFWFVVGSQFLYGPEVLETVAARAQEMADEGEGIKKEVNDHGSSRSPRTV